MIGFRDTNHLFQFKTCTVPSKTTSVKTKVIANLKQDCLPVWVQEDDQDLHNELQEDPEAAEDAENEDDNVSLPFQM